MVEYLSNVRNVNVSVFDQNAQAREKAEKDGYFVFNDVGEVLKSGLGVVLASCQHQVEQSTYFPGKYVFFDEAAYFFDKPYHFNSTRDFPAWIVENVETLAEVYLALSGDERWNFVENISFRASLNPRELRMHREHVRGMWFDVLRKFSRRKYTTILDVGAYDGDTLQCAYDQLGCEVAIAVEANPDFAEKISSYKGLYRDVRLLSLAAWSHECRLDFEIDSTGMFSVKESECGSVRAAALDAVICEDVDLLKIDIEGSELKALDGARALIASQCDLAIAAYHRPEDLTTIFRLITSNRPCKPHIRHYSDCLDDTIWYFI